MALAGQNSQKQFTNVLRTGRSEVYGTVL
jgi:hypothetical protein